MLSCSIGGVLPSALAQNPASLQLDADGVQMLLRSAPNASHLRLGSSDPNKSRSFGFDYKASAIANLAEFNAVASAVASSPGVAEKSPPAAQKFTFWRLPATALQYASGASGFTARLHLYASGGQQNFNWKTQKGYLSSPLDVKNQEFTVYVRVHEVLTPQIAQVTLKIRGGKHSEKEPDAGSCTMMTFAPSSNSGGVARFGKELSHPQYDYVKLRPALDISLNENTWIALKLLSYTNPQNPLQTINQMHIDTTPFDANHRPANQWRLISEYADEEGKSTGYYNQLVNWGGWQTTLRMDGYRSIDFAFASVREILPP